MIPLEYPEDVVLHYIRKHEVPDGVDVNSMVEDLESDMFIYPENTLLAVRSLYMKGYIERRYDGRIEIPGCRRWRSSTCPGTAPIRRSGSPEDPHRKGSSASTSAACSCSSPMRSGAGSAARSRTARRGYCDWEFQ